MVYPAKSIPYSEGLETLYQTLLHQPGRVLLFGPPGAGKSYLSAELARRLYAENQPCWCLSADPGSPGFGVPAAVNLGRWKQDHWQPVAIEALCTLDAARFRLPLAESIRKLLNHAPDNVPVIIDAPGLTRGIAAAELLTTLADITTPVQLAVLDSKAGSTSVEHELASLPLPVLRISASESAKSPNRHQRAIRRTQLWEQHLAGSQELNLIIDDKAILGTPPPLDHPEKWAGLLIALSDKKGLISLGEVLELQNPTIRLRCPALTRPASRLVVRDARHIPGQPLVTAVPKQATENSSRQATDPSLVYPSDSKPVANCPQIRRRDITAELVNGLFDDPLLLVKTNWSRRCLLFDLGKTSRLPLRHAHNVSHIFISHAHFDHIGGFMGMLRVRLGANAPCQLFGPPGLAQHIAGMLSGILWDRIGDNGPAFDVAELHGTTLHHFRLQAGHNKIAALPETTIKNGVIHREERFLIRTVELDHGTPVLAYAYEPVNALTVSKPALNGLKLAPGPWLGQLKYAYMAGEQNRLIPLPDGSQQTVAKLASLLLRKQEGNKLVYATDLADTKDNREKLTALARNADTLFCEAAFSEEDRQRGIDNSHLTTTACGEIAAAAGVKHLVPFHFSRRYEHDPEQLYREVAAAFPYIIRGV